MYMSIGFSFENTKCKQKKAFAVLEKLADEWGVPFTRGESSACLSFCRSGQLYFTYEEGGLSGSCQTNVAGPGFHKAAVDFTVEFLQRAKLSVSLDDETDYVTHRDFQRMRREHFYSWLGNIVGLIKREGDLTICWDLNQYTPAEISGSVITPMGRFTTEKLVRRVAEKGIESFAQDFFVWNEEEKDAYYFRNQALARLWEDCYFRASARSKEDESVNGYIRKNIEKAAQLSSAIPLPLADYRLLCELDGLMAPTLQNPELQSDYPVGYRKETITHRFGNLLIPLHGSFMIDDQEDDLVFYDGEENLRSVRMSAFEAAQPAKQFSENLFTDVSSAPEEFSAGYGRGKMAYAGQVKDGWHQVIAQILTGRQITLITVSLHDEADKEWAYSFLRRLGSNQTSD